jgi:hypothetical protein
MMKFHTLKFKNKYKNEGVFLKKKSIIKFFRSMGRKKRRKNEEEGVLFWSPNWNQKIYSNQIMVKKNSDREEQDLLWLGKWTSERDQDRAVSSVLHLELAKILWLVNSLRLIFYWLDH